MMKKIQTWKGEVQILEYICLQKNKMKKKWNKQPNDVELIFLYSTLIQKTFILFYLHSISFHYLMDRYLSSFYDNIIAFLLLIFYLFTIPPPSSATFLSFD